MNVPEDQLRRIIDRIPAMVWVCGPDGSCEFNNQRWREYTGLTLEQSLGWGWHLAIHPDDLGMLLDAWLPLIDTESPWEVEARLRRNDGIYRWFLIRTMPNHDAKGNIVGWYGTNTDIDDLKRVEGELRQKERDLQRIVDLIPQIIVVLDPEGKPNYMNPVALEILGVDASEVQSSRFESPHIHPDDVERLHSEREEALALGVPFDFELRLLQKGGGFRWFHVWHNPLLDEQGRIVAWYATATDVHDRVQAEERTRNENLALREQIDRDSMFEEIVGSSEKLRNILYQVEKVAPLNSTVLILGETGTGKEMIARAIHKRSNRASRAFIRVNCAAIPSSLIASELFGHEKGSFTGATQRRLGRFESANGGTIFLDEVGDLSNETQIALLRVLQEREIERVGSSQSVSIDVRVLAATHRDLNAEVAAGTFRQDLLYRLNVFPIQMPSLRERVDDVPLLVEYFVDRYGKNAGKKFRTIEKKTLTLFQEYTWPGNIRELQNVIERAVVLCEGDTFAVEETWLNKEVPHVTGPTVALSDTLHGQEKEMIEIALAESHGRIAGSAGAAVRLGIPAKTLESKIKRLGINKHQFKVARNS